MNELYNHFDIKISNKAVDYFHALKYMQNRVDDIINNKAKELIWFLSHDHIYTCGTSSDKKEILFKTNIPIINSNRGGKTTYHGPGQRIIYLIIDLNKRQKDIRNFINLIEKSIIEVLNKIHIEATSFPDRIGIWVTKANGKKLPVEKKIGAIGLRIKKWVTYHGLSFNLNPNLSYYDYIQPCGLTNYSVTSLDQLGIQLSQKKFDKMFINIFNNKLKSF